MAKRQASANGMLMQVITYVGGQVEDGMKLLPAAFRTKIEGA
ncbi:MAG: protein EcsC, partial [Marivivens sp.]|nr:protein EcsC [Marivivens sp.]